VKEQLKEVKVQTVHIQFADLLILGEKRNSNYLKEKINQLQQYPKNILDVLIVKLNYQMEKLPQEVKITQLKYGA